MYKYCIGMDNGGTGTIGVVGDSIEFIEVPVKNVYDFQKKKKTITLIKQKELAQFLNQYQGKAFILLERPLINPKMFPQTISAVRNFQTVLNVLELLEFPFDYIDSKEWQKKLLPNGIKGSAELKKASKEKGIRKYPIYAELIEKHGDADGLLIAEYCRLKMNTNK